jgi:hypothetical protein
VHREHTTMSHNTRYGGPNIDPRELHPATGPYFADFLLGPLQAVYLLSTDHELIPAGCKRP